MALAARTPTMTRDEFLLWRERQELRYEFDGFAPVLMNADPATGTVGGTLVHSRIAQNLYVALHGRVRPPCYVLGPDVAVAVADDRTRYPDAVVSCAAFEVSERLVPSPVGVFEVISPTSGRMDRIQKVREYAGVASVLRYVIVESAAVGILLLERNDGAAPWTMTTLSEADTLVLPFLGTGIPMLELYAGVPLEEG